MKVYLKFVETPEQSLENLIWHFLNKKKEVKADQHGIKVTESEFDKVLALTFVTKIIKAQKELGRETFEVHCTISDGDDSVYFSFYPMGFAASVGHLTRDVEEFLSKEKVL